MIKHLDFQLTTCENNIKNYCNKVQSKYEESVTSRFNEANNRLSEVKAENNKYSHDLIKRTESLNEEFSKYLILKENLYNKVDNEVNNIQSMFRKTNENFIEIKMEFDSLNGKYIDLSEFIKDVRFRKNLGTEVKKGEYMKIARKISNKGDKFGIENNDEIEDKFAGVESHIKKYINSKPCVSGELKKEKENG